MDRDPKQNLDAIVPDATPPLLYQPTSHRHLLPALSLYIGEHQPTGRHACASIVRHHIEHRLIPPCHPQTYGLVERFNGRISEVLNTTHCTSRDDLETLLTRYAYLYNQHIPQKALDHRTPIQALQHWQREHPELFLKRVSNHPGPDRPLVPGDHPWL